MKKVLLVFVLLFLLLGNYVIAQPTFEYVKIADNVGGRVGIGDIDGDGKNDIVSHVWGSGGGLFLYKAPNWQKRTIASAGNVMGDEIQLVDIDVDGDLDIVSGWDNNGGNVYWFENPSWNKHLIGRDTHHGSGSNDLHLKDVHLDDFDGDGKLDVVARHHDWLYVYYQNSPTDWQKKEINIKPHEGMHIGDIDGDGKTDVVLNGFWLKNPGDRTGSWGPGKSGYVIDDMWLNRPQHSYKDNAAKVQVGDMDNDGKNEVVISASEYDESYGSTNEVNIYDYDNNDPTSGESAWRKINLGNIWNCHNLQVADFNNDGHLDVLAARMRPKGSSKPNYVFYNQGDAQGFDRVEIRRSGVSDSGGYSGKVGDIDNDNDIDFVAHTFWKYSSDWPADLFLLRNTLDPGDDPPPPPDEPLSLDDWERHFIDNLPKRAMFVEGADIDGDGKKDLVAGGWWWKNPGDLGDNWGNEKAIGTNLNNMAVVDDFDNDGDVDILGTKGEGSDSNHEFFWAKNKDGNLGNFDILDNIQNPGSGDFLQGVALADFGSGKQVALSWHGGASSNHLITIPSNPSTGTWSVSNMGGGTLKEDLSAGDIDRDGDLDLLIGDKWLRNDGGSWSSHTIGNVAAIDSGSEPDRNDLADINGDGRLDAVIGLEYGVHILWYEAPANPTNTWTHHIIASNVGGQGFSMDSVDMDNDGDVDVIVGEHRGSTKNRVIIFENSGDGSSWTQHVIDDDSKGIIDHHDGTQAIDMDGDGDLDIISIGWTNPKLWVYENLAIDGIPPGSTTTTTVSGSTTTTTGGSGSTTTTLSSVTTTTEKECSGDGYVCRGKCPPGKECEPVGFHCECKYIEREQIEISGFGPYSGEPYNITASFCKSGLWLVLNSKGSPLDRPIIRSVNKTNPLEITTSRVGEVKVMLICFRPGVRIDVKEIEFKQGSSVSSITSRDYATVGVPYNISTDDCDSGNWIISNLAGNPLSHTIIKSIGVANPLEVIPRAVGKIKIVLNCFKPRAETIKKVVDVRPSTTTTTTTSTTTTTTPPIDDTGQGMAVIPGSVYKEYKSHQMSDNDCSWRVTGPDATDSRAVRYRNCQPTLHINIDDFDTDEVIKAELLIHRWGGHAGTKNKGVEVNGHLIPLPELKTTPEGHPPENYLYEDNPIIEIPLEYLKEGDNTLFGECCCNWWPQWGWMGVIFRIYYNPELRAHPTGGITSPTPGSTFGENPTITAEAQSDTGIEEIEILGYYEGYDENGDGYYTDWHHGYFNHRRGKCVNGQRVGTVCKPGYEWKPEHTEMLISEHVGTVTSSPYLVEWDTNLVPDQASGSVKLLARIKDTNGVWFVTNIVDGLNFERTDSSVKLYKAYGVPEHFGTRKSSPASCKIDINDDLSKAQSATLHVRTWNGLNRVHHGSKPLKINSWDQGSITGYNHCYKYSVSNVPPTALREVNNIVFTSDEREGHEVEILWPGPGLIVRYDK